MPTFTSEQVRQAMAAAEQLRDGQDDDGLGHYALYLHDRNKHLEEVYLHVRQYLRTGESPREHSMLVRAIEQAEKAAHPHEDGPSVFGD
jgi:hypothetical protein